jgi:hypothetical protein
MNYRDLVTLKAFVDDTLVPELLQSHGGWWHFYIHYRPDLAITQVRINWEPPDGSETRTHTVEIEDLHHFAGTDNEAALTIAATQLATEDPYGT